jgi:hypothetical protein
MTYEVVARPVPPAVRPARVRRAPVGRGHRYTRELVPARAGVLGLDPTADYGPVQRAIERAYRPV